MYYVPFLVKQQLDMQYTVTSLRRGFVVGWRRGPRTLAAVARIVTGLAEI